MINSETRKLSPLERFIYWITERHQIHLKRQSGVSKPWTNDEVLQKYFFTNPYREHDKVTVWVDQNIRQPFADHPNLWFMLCIARQLNRPETLQEMMDRKVWPLTKWDGVRAGKVLDAIKARGKPVYTGAYMIRAESNRRAPWYKWSKQQYMTRICLGSVWKKRKEVDRVMAEQSLEKATQWLMQFMGWGGFMAYEVVSDWRHTGYLRQATDIYTWANPGPGAQRGLGWLRNEMLNGKFKRVSVEEANNQMQNLMYHCQLQLPTTMPWFEMRDVEHSLCEYDKYNRMLFGTGRSKRKFNGV